MAKYSNMLRVKYERESLMNAFKSLINFIKVNINNAKQSYLMSRFTLKKTYSGSALGIGWSIVKPCVFIFVYWFGIQIGIRGGKPMDEAPFILWLIAGIIPWFFISDCMTIGCSSIKSNSHLVTKVVFPIETIPVFNVMAYLNTHLLMMVILLAIYVFSGYGLSVYSLQLLFYIPLIFIFGCILTTFLSTLSVISKDFQQLVKSTINVFFWLTPILWNADHVGGILGKLMKLNPIYYFIYGYRNSLIYKKWFFETYNFTIYFFAFLLIFALITGYLFNRLSKEFSDVM